MQQSDKYIAHRDELAEEDPSAIEIEKSEKDHGLKEGQRHTAIARKLTLVSEWSSRYQQPSSRGIRRNCNVFVADKRLWKWLDACLKTEAS
ncbi:MAG: hypothetical protein Q9224_003952 [Gallowayella concinna]